MHERSLECLVPAPSISGLIEYFGSVYLSFADEFVEYQVFGDLETTGEVVVGDEAVEVPFRLLMMFIVEAFDGRVSAGAVHPLDLTFGPGMVQLCGAMLDGMFAVTLVEHVNLITGGKISYESRATRQFGAVVDERRVDLISHGID